MEFISEALNEFRIRKGGQPKRVAVVESIETGKSKAQSIYNIQKISIPQSVWEEKDEILKNIAESIAESVCSLKFDIKVNINCDPECVETDYNGR